ncbi:MAG: hypothetical protein LBU32_06325 [Clostridiales bacterium]|nr:hypothetical protein [Clostridiales bacterium]
MTSLGKLAGMQGESKEALSEAILLQWGGGLAYPQKTRKCKCTELRGFVKLLRSAGSPPLYFL